MPSTPSARTARSLRLADDLFRPLVLVQTQVCGVPHLARRRPLREFDFTISLGLTHDFGIPFSCCTKKPSVASILVSEEFYDNSRQRLWKWPA